MQRPVPFSSDIFLNQIEQFHQGIIRTECSFGLCHFSELAMKSFDDIGCVDDLSDSRVILEILTEPFPISFSGVDNDGVFLTPGGFEFV